MFTAFLFPFPSDLISDHNSAKFNPFSYRCNLLIINLQAHSNCLEQMPLFATAVLSSLFAERVAPSIKIGGTTTLDPTGLSTYIAAFFAIRVAYTVAYVQITERKTSFVRSALWAAGLGLSIWQVVKAAKVLG